MVNAEETPTSRAFGDGSGRGEESEGCGFCYLGLLVSDPRPLSGNLLNNLKHIEDLTHVLKKEKQPPSPCLFLHSCRVWFPFALLPDLLTVAGLTPHSPSLRGALLSRGHASSGGHVYSCNR